MWKESYRVGVGLIDEQHKELFRMVDELLKAIAKNADRDTFQKAIEFLKLYVVYHFAAEEDYQESIAYCGIEKHKELHKAFTNTVLDFEKRLVESDFDIHIVKELAGLLTTWLIYHVADADQKIAKNLPVSSLTEQQSCILSVSSSLVDVLEKMTGLNASAMEQKASSSPEIHGDILVEVGLHGDIAGRAYFSYSKALAFKLMEIMMFSIPEGVDELVCSALAEISNIASGNAASALAVNGRLCDIMPPTVTLGESKSGVFDSMSINTGVGGMSVSVVLD